MGCSSSTPSVSATRRSRSSSSPRTAGRFREDLYYRLAVVELVVPPLREHREDIPLLVEEFVRRWRERFGAEDVRFSPDLVQALARAEWPGNVRQLENAVARLVALAPSGEIDPAAWQDAAAGAVRGAPSGATQPGEGDAAEAPRDGAPSLREHIEAVERGLIAKTLDATNGNQSEAARRLGLSRSALIDRLEKYGLVG